MNITEIPFWITATQWASRSVLVVLALLSVWSIATMIQCYRLLQKARGGTDAEANFHRLHAKINSGQLPAPVSKNEETTSIYQAVVNVAASFKDPMRIDR